MRLNFFIYFAEKFFFCVIANLFYLCVWLKISSSAGFVKQQFKNILTKLIFKIEEISTFKQNLLRSGSRTAATSKEAGSR